MPLKKVCVRSLISNEMALAHGTKFGLGRAVYILKSYKWINVHYKNV